MIESLSDLVRFLKKFHAGQLGDSGLDTSVIPRDLPLPLARIYKHFGALIDLRNEGPFGGHYTLFPVKRLQRIGDMFEFGGDYVAGYSFRCRANLTDPPVYSDQGKVSGKEDRFQIVCKSLKHFLTTLCLLQAVDTCRYGLSLDMTKGWRKLIIPTLVPLWKNGRFAWGRPVFDFFVVPRKMIIVMSCQLGWPIIIGSPNCPVNDVVRSGIEPNK